MDGQLLDDLSVSSRCTHSHVRESGLNDLLNKGIRLWVDRRGGFIEQENLASPGKSSHEGDYRVSDVFDKRRVYIRSCLSPALKFEPLSATGPSSLNFSLSATEEELDR